MDTQSLLTLTLLAPAAVFGVLGRRARRQGRTRFGLGLRGGAWAELGRGALFSLPFLASLVAIVVVTGTSIVRWEGFDAVAVVGIWVYFAVLFLVEEVVFRAVLMTGLGVVAGRGVALVVTAVLVAVPYAFSPGTGVLPLTGAVVTNLLHGWARWRSGRIWWGYGQRLVWNAGVVTLGFGDSAFSLAHPLLSQQLMGPRMVTGGSFGIEGGLIGIAFLTVMLIAATWAAIGRDGPWTVRRPHTGESAIDSQFLARGGRRAPHEGRLAGARRTDGLRR